MCVCCPSWSIRYSDELVLGRKRNERTNDRKANAVDKNKDKDKDQEVGGEVLEGASVVRSEEGWICSCVALFSGLVWS